jgi:hypothetical protein
MSTFVLIGILVIVGQIKLMHDMDSWGNFEGFTFCGFSVMWPWIFIAYDHENSTNFFLFFVPASIVVSIVSTIIFYTTSKEKFNPMHISGAIVSGLSWPSLCIFTMLKTLYKIR